MATLSCGYFFVASQINIHTIERYERNESQWQHIQFNSIHMFTMNMNVKFWWHQTPLFYFISIWILNFFSEITDIFI